MTKFDAFPKVSLSQWPTPIERWDRLSDYLVGPQIFAKRDDIGSLGLGGNKLRKLEYLIADARASGCDLIMTTGALQSNHARLTAAACARLGIDCHLVLKDEVRGRSEAYAHSSNKFLDHLFGARVDVVGAEVPIEEAFASRVDTHQRKGRKPYLIPVGGSNPIGCLGYVSAALEIASQSAEAPFSHIYVTSGSAGTHAGLVVGTALARLPSKLVGVSIARDAPEQGEIVRHLAAQTAELVGVDDQALADIVIDDGFYRPGYGLPNSASLEALSLCARLEGVVVDPVYTSKTMAALIADVRRGSFKSDDRILFIHTGGAPALFVYEEQFDADGNPILPAF
ncbi:D-cysteine desulfhydrase family protein [Rhizobium sp. ARZ01]|uniref:D-cysteine desulfhydrase family protein n=1 Tax=Rhizobium sp. ARZ01 TaxID=2769313 RepID=UPI0017856449|nr:D-cysteine desulfhydrase family protein [Rhizobium sp. ARZ01]MBD9373524.1 D-cysteine desulfhydrase family protein [Rhizobium sp. ARZ01]